MFSGQTCRGYHQTLKLKRLPPNTRQRPPRQCMQSAATHPHSPRPTKPAGKGLQQRTEHGWAGSCQNHTITRRQPALSFLSKVPIENTPLPPSTSLPPQPPQAEREAPSASPLSLHVSRPTRVIHLRPAICGWAAPARHGPPPRGMARLDAPSDDSEHGAQYSHQAMHAERSATVPLQWRQWYFSHT